MLVRVSDSKSGIFIRGSRPTGDFEQGFGGSVKHPILQGFTWVSDIFGHDSHDPIFLPTHLDLDSSSVLSTSLSSRCIGCARSTLNRGGEDSSTKSTERARRIARRIEPKELRNRGMVPWGKMRFRPSLNQADTNGHNMSTLESGSCLAD